MGSAGGRKGGLVASTCAGQNRVLGRRFKPSSIRAPRVWASRSIDAPQNRRAASPLAVLPSRWRRHQRICSSLRQPRDLPLRRCRGSERHTILGCQTSSARGEIGQGCEAGGHGHRGVSWTSRFSQLKRIHAPARGPRDGWSRFIRGCLMIRQGKALGRRAIRSMRQGWVRGALLLPQRARTARAIRGCCERNFRPCRGRRDASPAPVRAGTCLGSRGMSRATFSTWTTTQSFTPRATSSWCTASTPRRRASFRAPR